MTIYPKRLEQYIRTSVKEHDETIINATEHAHVYFSGAVSLVYLLYTLTIILAEYTVYQMWMPQNLYGFAICGISAVSWLVFKLHVLPRKYVIPVSHCFLCLLLILLAVGRGLGSIYVSYGLAACTAVATVVLSLNPLRYGVFALLGVVCEIIIYWVYAGFDPSAVLLGVGLYNTMDAVLLFIVSGCLNLFICILRYRIWDETSALKKESSIDALTGLYNRKYFEHYFRFHHRDDELAAMIHMDLDNFKALNDTLGHQQGDALLAKAAELLRNNFRKTDCVARVGGDEFMVFMPALSEPKHTVERVKNLLEQFPIVVREKDEEIAVSISIGVAFSEEGRFPSYQELYEKSDDAMYQAKKAGKKRAVFADCDNDELMIC